VDKSTLVMVERVVRRSGDPGTLPAEFEPPERGAVSILRWQGDDRRVDHRPTTGLYLLAPLDAISLESEGNGQADVQPAQPEAEEQAWLPSADEHARGPRNVEPSSQEGTKAARRFRGLEVTRPRNLVAAGDGREPEGLPRSRRLTRGPEIRAVLARGKRIRTRHLDVYDSASPVSRSRVGLIVPRYGGRIVDRNLVKRRLREILRKEILPRLRSPERATDVVVRARREAYGAAFSELRAELTEWLERRCSGGSSSR